MLFNSIIAAVLALALAAFYANKVLSIKVTDEKVEELSASIREGSMAFLKRMYSWISVFVVVLAVLISTLTEWGYPWGYVSRIFSGRAGENECWIGIGHHRFATADGGGFGVDSFWRDFRCEWNWGFSVRSGWFVVVGDTERDFSWVD